MALPVMATPTYELTIPSSKKKAKFRPFLVKEEKALLIAQQSEDENVMVDTLKSIVEACLFGNVDVEELAIFDLEYIFCQIRSRSVSELAEVNYKCLNCNDPKGKITIPIDLSKIEVKFEEGHASEIDLFEDVGVKMKYPSIDMIKKISTMDMTDTEAVFNIVVDSIHSVYSNDNVYLAADQTREEIINFIDNLTKEQFDKIEQFFVTMPKFQHEIEWDCPHCRYHHKTIIQGLDNFF